MPIEGVLDLQRRDAPVGEIRIGTSVEIPGKTGRKPVRLETFRFTTAWEQAADVIAQRYGGTVTPWERRKGRFEVTTGRKALDVWVPPRALAVDANMELWDGPKRLRKCDGRIEELSGKPCMCPQAGDPSDPASVQRARDERKRLASGTHPQACKPLTRINVTIPDLPGLTGTWKLNTGSENAAVETAGSGDMMVIAREGGVYLPAVLYIEWRYRAEDGSPYPVPKLMIGLSMQELAAGALPPGPGGLLAQLRSTGEQKAIGTGPAASPAPAVTPGYVLPPEPPADEDVPDPTMLDDRLPMTAQQIADLAGSARRREEVEFLAEKAKADGVYGDQVSTDPKRPDYYPLTLREYLTAVWKFGPKKAREVAA